MNKDELIDWLRGVCAKYVLEPIAVYRLQGSHAWPLEAQNAEDLKGKLEAGGHFLPLPKEPAALANVVEVSLVDFLLKILSSTDGVVAQRGTERGYPDIEITGPALDNNHYALDIKVARRHKSGKRTQSRITLYTGNTYFRWPELQWPGTFRPFQDYTAHLDLIALYTLVEESLNRIEDFELLLTESWRIGSKQRSSTTREYIGAVQSIADLKSGAGEFDTEADFYRFWRNYQFKTGRAVEQQLRKLLAEQNSKK
jgi:hypothetical protein